MAEDCGETGEAVRHAGSRLGGPCSLGADGQPLKGLAEGQGGYICRGMALSEP